MASCTSCGNEAKNLLEIFPGEAISEKLPFCADCVSLGACELPFLSDRELGPRVVLQRVIRVNRTVLEELRAARSHATDLEARVAELEKALLLDREF